MYILPWHPSNCWDYRFSFPYFCFSYVYGLCMCVCLCVCLRVCVPVPMNICTQGDLQLMLGIIHQHFCTLLVEAGSSLELWVVLASLSSKLPLVIFFPSEAGTTERLRYSCGFWGSELRPLCFCSKFFKCQAKSLPSLPFIYIFLNVSAHLLI